MATISFLSATSRFSMVVVFFQALRRLRFSTLPLAWLTDGMLILLLKVKTGGFSGYSGPHWICRL